LPGVSGSPIYHHVATGEEEDDQFEDEEQEEESVRETNNGNGRRKKKKAKKKKISKYAQDDNSGIDTFHRSFPYAVILTKNNRQACSAVETQQSIERAAFYQKTLTDIRHGVISHEDADRFYNETHIDCDSDEYRDHWRSVMHVYPKVIDALNRNGMMLHQQFLAEETFDASAQFLYQSVPITLEDAFTMITSERIKCESRLYLCNGAPVVILQNQKPYSSCVVNGTRGTVVGFIGKTDHGIDYILVKIDDASCTIPDLVVRYGGHRVTLHKTFALPRETKVQKFKNKNRQDDSIKIKYFPIMLSYACTIHKVEGLTVDELVVDLSGAWDALIVYVALSRTKKLEKLKLLSPLDIDLVNNFKNTRAYREIRAEIASYKLKMRDLVNTLIDEGWIPPDYITTVTADLNEYDM